MGPSIYSARARLSSWFVTTQQNGTKTTFRRRSGLLALALMTAFAGLVAVSGPAAAEVGVGWSDPEEVNLVEALLILGGIPIALALVITVLVYAPSLARGEGLGTGGTPESEWLGGPRRTTAELAGPDTEESAAGGASGRW